MCCCAPAFEAVCDYVRGSKFNCALQGRDGDKMNASATKRTVWTSKLNSLPQISEQFPHTAAPIRFYDTTLRDGEQSAGIILGPEHKLEIAKKLDAMGIGRIEAGFPRVSKEDAEAI